MSSNSRRIGGRIRRACRIVRVVDDQRLRARRDEAANFLRIGLPAVGRIGSVVHLARADLVEDGGVERIGRQRDEHLVAGVGQRRQHEVNALGGSRRHNDPIGIDRPASRGVLGRDRLACGRQSDRRSVPVLAVTQRLVDGLDHMSRGREAGRDGIADVHVVNPLPAASALRASATTRRIEYVTVLIRLAGGIFAAVLGVPMRGVYQKG